MVTVRRVVRLFSRVRLQRNVVNDPASGRRDGGGRVSRCDSRRGKREDSAELAVASRAIRRLIRRVFKTARLGEVGRPALEAVNRRETGERSNRKPFYAGQKVATIRKYS